MQKYLKPDYNGLERINELLNLSSGRGELHLRPMLLSNKTKVDFNKAGYVDEIKSGYKLLIIDEDPDGVLSAYTANHGGYRKLIKFTDPNAAAIIINDLHSNPYYHSSRYYQRRIQRQLENIDLFSFTRLTDLKSALLNIYHEARAVEERIQLGTRTFGCQHRFMVINHICVYSLNLYLSNFANIKIKLNKPTPIIYEGIDSGDVLRTYTESVMTKDDIVITDIDIFGPQIDLLGSCPMIEAKVLDITNTVLVELPANLDAMYRTAIWIMNERGIFKTPQQKLEFRVAISDADLDPRTKQHVFNTRYKALMKEAGYKVVEEE